MIAASRYRIGVLEGGRVATTPLCEKLSAGKCSGMQEDVQETGNDLQVQLVSFPDGFPIVFVCWKLAGKFSNGNHMTMRCCKQPL